MNEFKVKIRENGRINIPALCRKQLDLMPGDEIIIRVENCEIHMISLKQALLRAQSIVLKHTKKTSLLDDLKVLRKEDD